MGNTTDGPTTRGGYVDRHGSYWVITRDGALIDEHGCEHFRGDPMITAAAPFTPLAPQKGNTVMLEKLLREMRRIRDACAGWGEDCAYLAITDLLKKAGDDVTHNS